MPQIRDARRTVDAVRETLPRSPVSALAAIERTALSPMPMPKIAVTRLVVDVYRPASPTPAGPISSARTLVRTIPRRMLTTDDPPMRRVDLRICR
jgi:hypothetical protein